MKVVLVQSSWQHSYIASSRVTAIDRASSSFSLLSRHYPTRAATAYPFLWASWLFQKAVPSPAYLFDCSIITATREICPRKRTRVVTFTQMYWLPLDLYTSWNEPTNGSKRDAPLHSHQDTYLGKASTRDDWHSNFNCYFDCISADQLRQVLIRKAVTSRVETLLLLPWRLLHLQMSQTICLSGFSRKPITVSTRLLDGYSLITVIPYLRACPRIRTS